MHPSHPTPAPVSGGDNREARDAGRPGFPARFRRVVTFRRMETVSLFHSLVYLALLTCAFLLGGPQPFTFVLGLSHGVIWIGMAITSSLAVHFRVINLRLAIAVVLLGCVAPFFGSIEFLRQAGQRRQAAA